MDVCPRRSGGEEIDEEQTSILERGFLYSQGGAQSKALAFDDRVNGDTSFL